MSLCRAIGRLTRRVKAQRVEILTLLEEMKMADHIPIQLRHGAYITASE